ADVRGAGTEVSATGGLVKLQADSDAVITVFAVSGGGAGTFAGAGAVALNEISNIVEAYVSGGAKVDTANSISLSAIDQSTISAAPVAGVGGGGGAIAGAVGKNEIDNQVRAYLDGAGTQVGLGGGLFPAAGSVTLTAGEAAAIQTITVGGGGAGTFALVGS